MPMFVLARTLFGILSLVILGLAAWFLWSWYDGEWIVLANGAAERVRDDWRLATGLALLLWSFVGRWAVPPFLAKLDTGDESRPERGNGGQTPGPRGHMLYVEEHGPADGYPLILTHGWGLDSTIWRNLRLKLSGGLRLVIWDLPGLGRSPAPLSEISLDAFADNLAFLVERVGRPVVLVGHSIGGMTIQTLARNRPELFGREVAGVVLLNTTHTNPLRTMILSGLATALRKPVIEPLMKLTILLQPLAWLSAWQSYLSGAAHMASRLGFGRYVTCSQLGHVALLATRNPPGAQARGNLAMFDWDSGTGLANLKVPVLVIGGGADIVTRLEASRVIAGAAPDATLEVVVGRVNYQPNSWAGAAGPREDPQKGHRSFADTAEGEKRRVRPESFADHYSQARQFFISQTSIEQKHIGDALVFELSKCERPDIRLRMVSHLRNIHPDLAAAVAKGLGVELPEPALAAQAPRDDLPPSDPLSILKRNHGSFKGRKLGLLVSDGADARIVKALATAAKKEGALVEVVAPKIAGVTLSDGSLLPAKQKIDGGPSVLFDAVAVVVAEDAIPMLAMDGAVRDFLADAFGHCKMIGFTAAAQPLLDKAGVAPDEAVIPLATAKDAAAFFEACRALRFWDREMNVDLDALPT